MKKSVIAITAAALIAGSAAGLSGCGNKNTQNIAALSSNWYSFVTYKNIQPTFLGRENAEELEYEVTFDKPSALSTNYSAEYSDGTYSTLFYATPFESSLIHADYAASYEQATDLDVVYYYETRLDISVKFGYGNESSDTFKDTVLTKCYFLAVGDNLRPLYSEQTVYSHTPANYKTASLQTSYVVFDRVYKSYYNYTGSAVKTEITYNSQDKDYKNGAENYKLTTTGSLNKAANILFDYNSLDVAVRAMNLSSSLSQSISLFIPGSGVGNYSLTGKTGALEGTEKADLTALLTGAKLYNKPADDENGLASVAVDVSYSGDMTGGTQTYLFAAVENGMNNTSRATLLKKTTPLSFGLGTLTYSLKNIVSTLWNE